MHQAAAAAAEEEDKAQCYGSRAWQRHDTGLPEFWTGTM